MSALKFKNTHPCYVSMCKHIHTLAHTHTYAHINIFLNWNYSNLPLRWLLLLLLCAKAVRLLIPPVFFYCCCIFVHFVFIRHAYLKLWHCEPQGTCSASTLTHKCTGAQVIGTFLFSFFFFLFLVHSTPTKPLEAWYCLPHTVRTAPGFLALLSVLHVSSLKTFVK